MKRIPLAAAWLALLGVLFVLSIVVSVTTGAVDDQEREVAEAREWVATTYVATGERVAFDRGAEILPRSFETRTTYRVTAPDDAEVDPGGQVDAVLDDVISSRDDPVASDQPATQDLRVVDDEEHGVVQAGRDLAPASDVLASRQDDLDSATSASRLGTIATVAVAVVGVLALTALWLLPGDRRRRFAGRPLPDIAPPDGPFSDERWAVRHHVLPRLEKAALSPVLPGALVGLAVVAGPIAAVLSGWRGVIVLAGVAVIAVALLQRERQAAALRRAWATLGQESGMGLAPDTELRLAARGAGIGFRTAGVAGLAVAAVLLGFSALTAFAGLAVSADWTDSPAPHLLLLTGVVAVTSTVGLVAGGAQRRDRAAERRILPTANGGTSIPR